ncbi:centrosomal protein of 170 kDa isoform X3 [Danio rerio]|uniref:Centrosomal protein of 170 kDa isoform X3 n=1 Tax=Danio rerio TaxID=7955 RepID=A0AC58JT92_DANRE|nr:centrosomal protein of 170 kDa isoform X2 [Danio rerio]XP_021332662.1 centrosomal protein of 170 kDa isoform X2 [Danio rerio]|eukprot:XP_003198799.2 centrosomal protein of 170 kDa isoform X2 [Danio rerio]
MSLTSWFLVSGGGIRHRLPREMIFVGRDDCELMLQSRSVDKQHAVINYEEATDEHKVKDLGSLNGTFVNDVRILEQQYITLKMGDKLRFGYDTNLFTVLRGELHVPEEALKHEKYTSQLQLTKKPSPSGETTKSPEVKGAEGGKETEVRPSEPAPKTEEKVSGDIAVLHRGTPLYGQPSWWGDGDADDENSIKHDAKQARCEAGRKETATKSQMGPETTQNLGTQEPSYFEIPSKETPPVGEETRESLQASSEAVLTTPALEGGTHGHASFTIEFDTAASGKGNKVSKSNQDLRPRPKRGAGEELSALQAAMVAAEVKVADWLAQNELPIARSESVAEEDGDSVKSDVPVQLRSLRGSKHEDGTQSDTENALGEQLSSRRTFLQERYKGRQAVQRTEGPVCGREDLFQYKPSSAARKMAPIGGEVSKKSSRSSPQKTNVPREQSTGSQETPNRGHIDDQSDRGTYTIELENGSAEVEEARRMIDKVFGVEDNQALTKLRFPKHQKDRGTICPRSGAMETRQTGYVGAEALPDDLVVVGGPRWVSQWASLAASHIRTDPEGSGAEPTMLSTDEKETKASERKRRTLPQLPSEDSTMDPLAPEVTQRQFGQTASSSEKQDLELQEKVDQLNRISKTGPRVSAMACTEKDRSKVSKPTPPRIQNKVGQTRAQAGQIEKKQEDGRRKKGDEDKEKTGKPLLRQESFTVERPSANVPLELIPCIDGPGASTQPREMGVISEVIDASTMQKDSEAVAAFLETTLSDLADPPSYSLEGSASPESDIDTTSTVSQAGGEGGRKTAQKKRLAGRETTNKNAGATERKGKAQPSGSAGSRAWTSLDLTDDDLSSSLAQDATSVKRPQGRGQNISSKAEQTSGKTKGPKTSVTPAAPTSKPTTLPRPRPTRASILRRARLGETSETDLADVDRMSVASEASTASSASRPSAGRRTLSRIEALAQPRRPRVCSPSARSDSEATSGKIRGFAPRPAPESALRLGLRSTGVSTTAAVPRARANSASKLPDKCPGTLHVQSTPAAGGRWRRVPIEYASTSEDEYGSNRHPSHHTRPRPMAPRVTQLGGSAPATPSPGGMSMLRHQSSREQDDYMRDWTAHSEEIARISQDLAKDLAMLAREIHDVAGEIDSVSPSSAPSASVEDRVFEDVLGSAPEISGRGVELRPRGAISSQDPRAIRRRTWSRDEGVLDSLLLASVSQLSAKIKQAVEKTANKIRILFKDKDRKWEEIESKLRAENEVLLLKTSNQEISSILQNLKRVERQLLVIDIMVDPDGTLDALSNLGLTSPLMAENRVSPGSQGPAGNQAAEASASITALPSAYSEVAERDLGLQERSKEQNTVHQN